MSGKASRSNWWLTVTVACYVIAGRCALADSPIGDPDSPPRVLSTDPAPAGYALLPGPAMNSQGTATDWWVGPVAGPVLDRDRWVRFDLQTVLLDTLANSPRILGVAFQTSATYQRIVQQDAAFDSTMLLGSHLGATNDPVGNTLTTGGADRLLEESLNFNAGVRRKTRRGTEIELQQQFGLLDSNSSFFLPRNQGNARLSLNLNKPLLSRGGKYYNERLVTQAQIESQVAWQEMRGEVEQRIADVIVAYWQLYQLRAQLTQQRALVARSERIEALLSGRQGFDATRIEIAKARQRVARRSDQVIDLDAELMKQQTRLAVLVGSDTLLGAERDLELIPANAPTIPESQWQLRDAVSQALQNRPEVRAATHAMAISALELQVTRAELEPQLNWVFNGYLAQLNGASQVGRSLVQQFEQTPGVSTGLEFELPRGRRAFRAQHQEALMRYRQRSEQLREVIKQTQFEVETALIDIRRYGLQQVSKRKVLSTAIVEENILTVQWEIAGGDGSRVGIKLENLLDAQRRRTDAEQDMAAVESAYMIALVALQRAMGTLLINEGVQPTQSKCSGDVDFLQMSQVDQEIEAAEPAK
ncbi:TolC family protein [Stieleria sp. TO1_6]|uniref:TolC family protein n=1 Tax=Stieleria tagensis TaxID=2956795 RepID=UPI00209AABDF|nr:TolC family protein [Stieleria tagensis]MCO8122210.1 TolC family protein [Stieleria tagensis]